MHPKIVSLKPLPSEPAKQHYIPGPKGNPIYYDFGSILSFIEETLLPPNTFIYPTYPYADEFAGINNVGDLSDFFDCFGPQCPPFQPITLVNNSQVCNSNACPSTECYSGGPTCQCDAACFIHYKGDHRDPDTY